MAQILQYGDGPQAIRNDLRNKIIRGNYPTGYELNIQALSREFGVSIVPVREALRMLAAENLVEMRPRRSPLVAKPDEAEILEINEIRQALEPLALAAAVDRHNEETLAECHRIVAEDRRCTEEWRRVELNWRFHNALLAPSKKTRTLQTIEAQFGIMSLFAQLIVVQEKFISGTPHDEHEAILEAVEQRRTNSAVMLLKEHIRHSGDRMRKVLENR